MNNYSQAVREIHFFKAVKTSLDQIEFMCVNRITTEAQGSIKPNMPPKPCESNVK